MTKRTRERENEGGCVKEKKKRMREGVSRKREEREGGRELFLLFSPSYYLSLLFLYTPSLVLSLLSFWSPLFFLPSFLPSFLPFCHPFLFLYTLSFFLSLSLFFSSFPLHTLPPYTHTLSLSCPFVTLFFLLSFLLFGLTSLA